MKKIIQILSIIGVAALLPLFISFALDEADVSYAKKLGKDRIIAEYNHFVEDGTLIKGTSSYNKYVQSVEKAFGKEFVEENF